MEDDIVLENLPLSPRISHRNSFNLINENDLLEIKNQDNISILENDYKDLQKELISEDNKYLELNHFLLSNLETQSSRGELSFKESAKEIFIPMDKGKIILKSKKIKKFWLKNKIILPSIFKLYSKSFNSTKYIQEHIDFSKKKLLKSIF